MECDGRGYCKIQQGDGNVDINPNPDCEFACVGIKCANYLFCKSIESQCIYDTNTNDKICKRCDIDYGIILDIKEEPYDCPICMENKPIKMKWPGCTHWYCIDCLNRIKWGPECKCQHNDDEQGDCLGCPCCRNQCDCTCDGCKDGRDEEISSRNSCPLCRHKHIQPWLKKMIDKDPDNEQFRNLQYHG